VKHEEEYFLSNMKNMDNFGPEVDFICTHFDFDIFVDAGPNAPFTEAWLVRQKNPGCHIIGFEPHPNAFKKLHTYFYPGMLSRYALSRNSGMIRGAYIQDHATFAKINDKAAADWAGVTMDDLIDVETVSIDQVLQCVPSLSSTFIWADVEGSELDIIMGAHESLGAKRICGFMLELNTTLSSEKKAGCHWKEVTQILGDYGFCPVGLFNLQPTHFDCVFSYTGGKQLWSEDELSIILDEMMGQYIIDPSQVPHMYTFEHVYTGMSFSSISVLHTPSK
jgi:FkbM family methyltransferase